MFEHLQGRDIQEQKYNPTQQEIGQSNEHFLLPFPRKKQAFSMWATFYQTKLKMFSFLRGGRWGGGTLTIFDGCVDASQTRKNRLWL